MQLLFEDHVNRICNSSSFSQATVPELSCRVSPVLREVQQRVLGEPRSRNGEAGRSLGQSEATNWLGISAATNTNLLRISLAQLHSRNDTQRVRIQSQPLFIA